jgi:DNA-binding response OmpR family regulator
MGKKILVVDDTRDILAHLQESLLMEGYDVLTATNGKEALRHLEHEVPDLIITDLVMPQMDGFTFIREVKKQEKLRGIPILIFSAKPMEEEGKRIAELGADSFLLKPSSTEVILSSITALISK